MTLDFETFVEFQTKSIVYDNIKRPITNIFETKTIQNNFWLHYIGHIKPDFFGKTIPENYINVFGNDVPNNYHKAYSFVQEKIQEHLEYVLESAMRICLVIEYYKKNNTENKKIKLIKIFIYSSYLICWLYVLFISTRTYTISSQDIDIILHILHKFQYDLDDFSGLNIIKIMIESNYVHEKTA